MKEKNDTLDDVILFIEDHKNSTQNILETVSIAHVWN